MDYYFAPLEGLTYPEYRIAHSHHFSGCSAYFAPFLATGGSGVYKPSYLKKHLPDNEYGIRLIPQILSNNAQKFLELADVLYDIGYSEINLNAGCPSGTVFSKHKGSGMLLDLNSLDSFLETVYSKCRQKVSIKTRMGVNSTIEFPDILKIYKKYPLSELIIHARSKIGMYSFPVDIVGFSEAFNNCDFPVCYNGDIFSEDSLSLLRSYVPDISHIMLGRGIIANPGLPGMLEGSYSITSNQLLSFHEELKERYLERGLTPNYVVERLKNIWQYMDVLFPDSAKQFKTIRKTKKLEDYDTAVSELFSNFEFCPNATFTEYSSL